MFQVLIFIGSDSIASFEFINRLADNNPKFKIAGDGIKRLSEIEIATTITEKPAKKVLFIIDAHGRVDKLGKFYFDDVLASEFIVGIKKYLEENGCEEVVFAGFGCQVGTLAKEMVDQKQGQSLFRSSAKHSTLDMQNIRSIGNIIELIDKGSSIEQAFAYVVRSDPESFYYISGTGELFNFKRPGKFSLREIEGILIPFAKTKESQKEVSEIIGKLKKSKKEYFDFERILSIAPELKEERFKKFHDLMLKRYNGKFSDEAIKQEVNMRADEILPKVKLDKEYQDLSIELAEIFVLRDDLSSLEMLTDNIYHKSKLAENFSHSHLLHIAALSAKNKKMFEYLSNKFDINKEKSDGTPLMVAASKGNFEAVKCLIELGADPKIVSYTDKTALDIAQENKNKKITEYLREKINQKKIAKETKRKSPAIMPSKEDYSQVYVSTTLSELGKGNYDVVIKHCKNKINILDDDILAAYLEKPAGLEKIGGLIKNAQLLNKLLYPIIKTTLTPDHISEISHIVQQHKEDVEIFDNIDKNTKTGIGKNRPLLSRVLIHTGKEGAKTLDNFIDSFLESENFARKDGQGRDALSIAINKAFDNKDEPFFLQIAVKILAKMKKNGMKVDVEEYKIKGGFFSKDEDKDKREFLKSIDKKAEEELEKEVKKEVKKPKIFLLEKEEKTKELPPKKVSSPTAVKTNPKTDEQTKSK